MAYNAVAQADLEVASNATGSDPSRCPSLQTSSQCHGFQQLPLDAGSLGAGDLELARAADDISVGCLVSMIRTMSSTSYDMVEEDDYEEAVEPKSNSSSRCAPPPIDTMTATKTASDNQPPSASFVASPDQPALQSPTSDHPVPLNHPTPDLQSLQGAYLGNVERLERSAERMSAGSADIAMEIRKMDIEQKRRGSTSSVANSVAASNHVSHSSPRGSVRSANRPPLSRLAQVSEHGHEDGEFNDPVQSVPVIPTPPADNQYNYDHQYYPGHVDYDELEQTSSIASMDTYQQAKILFSNFDGVHCVPQDKSQGPERQASLNKPAIAKQSKSYRADNMVYYPAPIPTTLNLPPRLSDRPAPAREKGRMQRLSAVLLGNRRSLPGLSDRPATSRGIEVTQTSPVETLDRILDDTANTPVMNSTVRPHTSSNAQRHSHRRTLSKNLPEQKKKRSSRSLFRFYKRNPSPTVRPESVATHLSRPTETEVAATSENMALQSDVTNEHVGGMDHSEEGVRDYMGPPNTLMAELETRKHELQHRTRTAPDSMGMRSTLLQLDAVAQKQSERRRNTPTSMTWNHNGPINDNNDDVPLGMLYPEKPDIPVDTRPLGLMEKRELEENEPLSSRRARLRGEQPPSLSSRPSTMYLPDFQNLVEPDSGGEEETLAQRTKRLKAKNRNSTATGSDFTSEVLAEISHLKGSAQDREMVPEETLAELRSCLQRDSKPQLNRYAKIPRTRRSMGSVSLMHPSTTARKSSYEPAIHHTPIHPQHVQNASRPSMHQMPVPVPPNYGQSQYAGYRYPVAMANSYGYGMTHHPNNSFYSDAVLGTNRMSMNYYYPNMETPDPVGGGLKQREMIDRWRQSVI